MVATDRMSKEKNLEVLMAAWDAVGQADWDSVASYFAEDMIFVMPGQTDVLSGRSSFRSALGSFGTAVPPGFEISDLRYLVGEAEIVNIVEWKAEKIPDGTQSAVLFKFNAENRITEERWYVDTEQWKAAY